MAKLAALKRKKAEKSFEGIVAGLAEGLGIGRRRGAADSELCKHPGILS